VQHDELSYFEMKKDTEILRHLLTNAQQPGQQCALTNPTSDWTRWASRWEKRTLSFQNSNALPLSKGR
jgi:hypothetical protein